MRLELGELYYSERAAAAVKKVFGKDLISMNEDFETVLEFVEALEQPCMCVTTGITGENPECRRPMRKWWREEHMVRVALPDDVTRMVERLSTVSNRECRSLRTLQREFYRMKKSVFDDNANRCSICGAEGELHLVRDVPGRKLATACFSCTGKGALRIVTWRKVSADL